ncbi:MAG: hypothetical protein ACP5SD_03895, partial [Elusimicrobiales bacterium]
TNFQSHEHRIHLMNMLCNCLQNSSIFIVKGVLVRSPILPCKKKEKQKQAEQFLDMIKNQEKQNLKQLQSKPNNQGAIKNEFDW